LSLIRQVLQTVEQNKGVMSLNELSRQVDMQPAALQGVLDFCVQKGYLKVDAGDGGNGCTSCASGGSCKLARTVDGHRPVKYRLWGRKRDCSDS
jgi:hypothetical protein